MDYVIIKEAVLQLLGDGPLRNIDLRIKLREKGHEVAANPFDRILRKMRIGGLIEWHGGKWHSRRLVKCDKCQGKGFHDAPAFVSE